MLRRPTDDESRDFKTRIRYLVDVSGKGPGWWEAKDGWALGRGQVHRWADPNDARGANVGLKKAKQAAAVFGVHWQWLADGELVNGQIFLDDPVDDTVERRLERIENALRHQSTPPPPATEERRPALSVKKSGLSGRNRPR